MPTFADLTFSNSLAVERNTLVPGVIGHIARNETIDPETFVSTQRHFHYGQVSTVVSTIDRDGKLLDEFLYDSYGNRLVTLDDFIYGGVWESAANRAGWGQNTKGCDPASHLTYMYQHWYDPALGIFTSTAPYPPMMERDLRPTPFEPRSVSLCS